MKMFFNCLKHVLQCLSCVYEQCELTNVSQMLDQDPKGITFFLFATFATSVCAAHKSQNCMCIFYVIEKLNVTLNKFDYYCYVL